MMRGFGIAIALAYVGAILTEKLDSIYAMIIISIVVAILLTKGDEWSGSILKKLVSKPNYGITSHTCNPIETHDFIGLNLFFTNKSHRALYIENVEVRTTYISSIWGTEMFAGKDSMKVKRKLKFDATADLEITFSPSHVLAEEIQGAFNQDKPIPLKVSLDWNVKILGVPINYISNVEYSNFPTWRLK